MIHTILYGPTSGIPQYSPTRIPQSGNSVDHCYDKGKATKQPIQNRMVASNGLGDIQLKTFGEQHYR